MDKVAVVILNWNGRKMLENYLPSVVKNTAEGVIYIADNASTDDSLQFVSSHYPSVKIIRLDKNYGFAEGYNRALSQIDAEYFLLLNNDIYTPEGWLRPLIDFMDNNHDVAACAPKLLSDKNRHQFEYAGASGGYIDKYGYPYCRGRIFNTVETDCGQYNDSCNVLWATGACLLTRAYIYNDVGGFDSRFFAHCEEIDYCWRLNILGHRVSIVPASYVYHLGGGTLNKSNPMKTYLNFRNNLTMLYKNLNDKELRKTLAMRRVLDYVAALEMLLLQWNYRDAMAVIRGRTAFKKWKHEFDKDRETIQLHAASTQHCRPTPLSILWHYYIKRHKTFDKLQ